MGGLSPLCHSSSGRAKAASVAAFGGGVSQLAAGWQMDHQDQGVEGLFLLSSCVGAAWLQARAACTGVGKLSAYWCGAGRAGLFV